MLGVIAGYDELDPASADTLVPDYWSAFKTPLSKLRLGMPRVPFFDAVDPEIANAVGAAVEVLGKLIPYWNGRSDGKSRPARGARSGGAAP
jgi:aspartyl-tRNA(Asn)/glutamyl-tRNA(Gln) amidotransferase subunit A